MKCSCKKTFCNNRICKCKKSEEDCGEHCACNKETCKNRQTVENASHAIQPGSLEAAIPNQTELGSGDAVILNTTETGSLDEAINLCQKELELLDGIRRKVDGDHIPQELLRKLISGKKDNVNSMQDILQKMEEVSISDAEVLSVEDWKKFEDQLKPCKICQRKFIPSRLHIHEKSCKK